MRENIVTLLRCYTVVYVNLLVYCCLFFSTHTLTHTHTHTHTHEYCSELTINYSDSTREHRAVTQPQQSPHAIADGYVLRKKGAECTAVDEELAP